MVIILVRFQPFKIYVILDPLNNGLLDKGINVNDILKIKELTAARFLNHYS